MNIYVASSWKNVLQPSVVTTLREDGHTVYDFKNPSPGESPCRLWSEIDPKWKFWTPDEFNAGLDHPIADDGFGKDMTALESCSACVLVLPCGKSAHLELGWAAGAKKLTVVYIPGTAISHEPEVSLPVKEGQFSAGSFTAPALSEPELMYKMCDYVCTSMAEVRLALSHKRPPPRWQRDVAAFDARAKKNGMDPRNLRLAETWTTLEEHQAGKLGPCRPYHHRECAECKGCWRHGACICGVKSSP